MTLLANVALSDTFRVWFDRTNETIVRLNSVATSANTVSANSITANTVSANSIDISSSVNGVNISNAQWGYLGNLDQNLRTSDSVTFGTVDTGQGANELYPMDQAVRTTDTPSFSELTVNGQIVHDPEHATDSGTDAYVSATNTTVPGDGVKIVRDFQSDNTTATPTLDGKTMTTRDGSALEAGAVSGLHDLQYDLTADTYLVLDPISTATAPAKIATGIYTGDGSETNSITGLGLSPKWVRVWKKTTVDATEIDVYETTPEILDNTDPEAAILYKGTGGIELDRERFVSLDSDGFTVSDGRNDRDPNKTGETYEYVAVGL